MAIIHYQGMTRHIKSCTCKRTILIIHNCDVCYVHGFSAAICTCIYVFYLNTTIRLLSHFYDYCTDILYIVMTWCFEIFRFSRVLWILVVAVIMCLLMLEGE